MRALVLFGQHDRAGLHLQLSRLEPGDEFQVLVAELAEDLALAYGTVLAIGDRFFLVHGCPSSRKTADSPQFLTVNAGLPDRSNALNN